MPFHSTLPCPSSTDKPQHMSSAGLHCYHHQLAFHSCVALSTVIYRAKPLFNRPPCKYRTCRPSHLSSVDRSYVTVNLHCGFLVPSPLISFTVNSDFFSTRLWVFYYVLCDVRSWSWEITVNVVNIYVLIMM